mgnify:CR=1 FL=1
MENNVKVRAVFQGCNIKTGKTSKKNVWSVNTEKSYHEEK